ncbi:MAG TPA: OmpA family protein [Myxococcota bacterium]|nr:OmpA family protein [Myxococcota bacterium]
MLLIGLVFAEPVHLVAVDAHGRVVEEAVWTAEAGEVARTGDGTVELPPGHHRLAVSAEGFFGATVDLDVRAGKTGEIQAVLDASMVTLEERRIVIHDAIYFETNKAIIKPESHDLCRQIARLIVEHPELRLVSVEGHADARGTEDFNLELSTRRAAAVVDFLVGQGVSSERLQSRGWGELRPVVEGVDEEAWSQNRRVEFLVVERAD